MNINNIEQHASVYGVPIIRNETHNLLEKIVRDSKPKHILEIGTAIGFSGIIMLKNSIADLVTIEHDKKLAKQAKQNFKKEKVEQRTKILVGDCQVEIAKMTASRQFDDYFDLIFLDGPKAQYDSMLENLLYLLAPGGTFVADNVLFRGYVEGSEKAPTRRYKTIIKRLNTFIENCKNNPKFTNFELKNIEDGIIIAQKVKNEK